MGDTFRVTVANLQTGIGTTRGYWNYLTTAHRYLFAHDSVGVAGAARYLRAERIDIAAFCEIEAGSRRTRELNQVQVLADSTELRRYFFFPTFVTGRRINMGNAVCSRYPVHPIRNHRLPGKGEPRFVSEAEVMSPGGAIRVFVTHLSLERKIRVPQIGAIAELLQGRDEPLMLAGDFNVTEEAELNLLSRSHLKQVVSAPTYPAWKPTRRYDHLFFSRHFHILDAHAFDGHRFSDHLPLLAEVELRGERDPELGRTLP